MNCFSGIIIVFFISAILLGCSSENPTIMVSTNDTTQILKVLLDSTLPSNQNTDQHQSYSNDNPLGDTMILKFDSILIGHVPPNYKIKILTKQEICALATKYKKRKLVFNDILEIGMFKKNGLTYKASIERHCIIPIIDLSEITYKIIFYNNPEKCKCTYDLYCNSSFFITFSKQSNYLKIESSSFYYD